MGSPVHMQIRPRRGPCAAFELCARRLSKLLHQQYHHPTAWPAASPAWGAPLLKRPHRRLTHPISRISRLRLLPPAWHPKTTSPTLPPPIPTRFQHTRSSLKTLATGAATNATKTASTCSLSIPRVVGRLRTCCQLSSATLQRRRRVHLPTKLRLLWYSSRSPTGLQSALVMCRQDRHPAIHSPPDRDRERPPSHSHECTTEHL